MMFRFKIPLKLILFFSGLIIALALFAQQKTLEIDGGWIREMPPGSPTLAAYMTITNSAHSEVKIIGVSSTVSRLTEIHDVNMENDVMKMREVSELIIQPGESVELKQGSMHVMLIDVAQMLKEGDQVEIEFQLEDGPPISTVVPVAKQ